MGTSQGTGDGIIAKMAMMKAFLISGLGRRGLFCAILLSAAAIPQTPPTSGTVASDGEATNALACRFASYGNFQEAAWTHLSAIGIRHVFMNVPSPNEVDAIQGRLREHGLTAIVLRGDTDLSKATSIDDLTVQLETCERMGVKYMFLSPKRHGADKVVIYDRLRKAGEVAARHGVTIALETHPDLGTNGNVHLETMKAIDHPNVRVNFDTGNITYYNENADAAGELRKIIAYVATVELKDHTGEFKTWNFPPAGQGVVDMPEILRILRQHGYTGPLTLEFEGIKGVELDKTQTKQAIEESIAYVRSLGTFR